MKYKFIKDGIEINNTNVQDWSLEDYVNRTLNKITISFVGFIIKRDSILMSFPKNYNYEGMSIPERIDILKNILNIMVEDERSQGSYTLKNKDEFPYKAYFDVAMYYKLYGIHFTEYREEKMDYSGNINWNKTFRKSEKYISDDNIIFMPFVINKKFTLSNFIGECMEFVLSDAYSNYSEYIIGIIPYVNKPKNKIFNNFELCYKNLISIRNKFFKDIDKQLINSLINYFKWKSQHLKSIKMVTTKFEAYWEKLVENYLNTSFAGVDESHELILGINKDTDIRFNKVSDYIENFSIRKNNKRAFSIEYDHLYVNDDKKLIYLFDSKYYAEEAYNFNYKQAYYYYHLRDIYQDYEIYNGLILPTEKEYYSKVHVDRATKDDTTRIKQDGLKIIEYYINLKYLIDLYLNR